MPMIDVYAPAGAFEDKHDLARRLAAAVMAVEEVPDIAMFRQNTAAFIHDLPVDEAQNDDFLETHRLAGRWQRSPMSKLRASDGQPHDHLVALGNHLLLGGGR